MSFWSAFKELARRIAGARFNRSYFDKDRFQ